MAESLAFYSQTKAILETAIRCAVDLTAGNKKGELLAKVEFDKMVGLLADEASRKINSIFLQLLDSANKETLTLRDKTGELERQLKLLTEDLEINRLWRESLINGWPLVNQDTGCVSTLQPCGILVKSTDEIPEEVGESTISADVKSTDESPEEVGESTTAADAKHTEDVAEPDDTTASSEAREPRPAKAQKKMFECDVCKKTFSRQFYLRKHSETHNELLSCRHCPLTFRSSVKLELHLQRHEKKAPKSFACLQCSKIFKSKKLLGAHQKVQKHGVLNGKSCTCEICGTTFTLPQSLKRHMRIHTGERPFKCQVCGASFVQDKLKAHMLVHGATKPFMCDLCGKTFLYNWQLKKHQAMDHQEGAEAPARTRKSRAQPNRKVIVERDRSMVEVVQVGAFHCQTCQRGFNSEAALQRHQRIHTGSAPYSCGLCGKLFVYKATFDYHLRTHSGERPYACDMCDKTFIVRYALKTHRLQHTGEKPHVCKHCGKAFRIYTNYLRHLRIHTGEKPYECGVCGVRFRQLAHVKYHMQVHTGERPYTCAKCGLGFSDSRQMKKHACAGKVAGVAIQEDSLTVADT